MKLKMKHQRGQALIIIAFAIIGLVAITGLAVDGSLAFSDRRHAQNAADTAALAGAMAKIKASEIPVDEHAAMVTAAKDMALENGYTDNKVSNTVYVYACNEPESSCGINYQGDSNYVQVIIESHIDTFFARVIGINKMDNRVQAIALAEEKVEGSLYNSDNIISLSQQCENPVNFSVQGNPVVTVVGGGLFVNTDEDNPECGFTCNSGSAIINGDISSAGSDIDPSAQCGENVTGETSTDEEQWDFPVGLDDMGLAVPEECDSPLGTYTNYNGTYPGYPGIELTVLTPGSYSNFPPKKEQPLGNLFNTILMTPGVYCVNNVVKLTEQTLTLIGEDVTFFIRAGHDFDLNGGTMILDAPNEGPYAGYLMIVEPYYGNPLLSVDPQNCVINGGATNSFTGAIFAPYCNVTVNGGSENISLNTQIIAYTVKVAGTATISFIYDADENPQLHQPPETGLIK